MTNRIGNIHEKSTNGLASPGKAKRSRSSGRKNFNEAQVTATSDNDTRADVQPTESAIQGQYLQIPTEFVSSEDQGGNCESQTRISEGKSFLVGVSPNFAVYTCFSLI